MMGICSFQSSRPAKPPVRDALQSCKRKVAKPSVAPDRQASFGAPIFACIRSLPGQQTEVLEKDIDFRSSVKAM
jgi:hypothetical protein